MKNSNKILLLFIFLFIYFVLPTNALALQTVCKCEGEGLSGELNIGAEENSGAVNKTEFIFANGTAPNGYQDKITDRPSSNTKNGQGGNSNNFDPVSTSGSNGKISIQCPSYIILENTTTDKVYLYGNNQATEANNFRSSSSMKNSSVLMNCTVENSQNSVVDNNDKETNTQQQIDETGKTSRERNKNKPSPYKQAQNVQTCEQVFGNSDEKDSVAWILQKLFNYIRIFGIFLVVVLSALDYSKVILSSDYEMLKKNQLRFVYRVVAVVALLLLPTLVNFLLGLFISGSVTDFSCGIY